MSVARRVGQELLADYGEKVLALEASDYFVLFRDYDCRIRVVDEKGFDREIEFFFADERWSKPPLV